MMTQIVKGALTDNPYVLFSYGAIEKQFLQRKLDTYSFQFPEELIQFWIEYGGGDLFETETILSPIPSDNEFIYDIEEINAFRYENGLDTKYLVFEENGCEMAAFDKYTKEVVIISKSDNKIENGFKNINKWFEYFWQVNQ